MRRVNLGLLVVLVALVTLLGLATWTYVARLNERVTAETVDLARVRWIEPGHPKAIEHKKVVLIFLSQPDNEDPLKWTITARITDPDTLDDFASALRKWRPGPAWGENASGGVIQVVCEDNIGVRLPWTQYKGAIHGYLWQSHDLNEVILDYQRSRRTEMGRAGKHPPTTTVISPAPHDPMHSPMPPRRERFAPMVGQ
ncbi:MAG: hypothetical protein GXY55_06840 [Phycisphaerae bacterium]|nr:hypothetical protein [Phycisphaerae bacterium]